MTKVTLNIDKFTLIPMYWEFNNIREFTDFIRSEMFNILNRDILTILSNLFPGLA